VQETVAHLGELDPRGRAKAAALARQITGRAEQRELFEAAPRSTEVVSAAGARLSTFLLAMSIANGTW
jgi:hypothetical protein